MDVDPTMIQPHWRPRSYIAGKSAPTTPGVLSRVPSYNNLKPTSSALGQPGSKSYTHIALMDEVDLSKTKSMSSLPRTEPQRPSKKRISARFGRDTDSGEWLFRAGTAITSEARESKGQSWLVSRESSTSLASNRKEDGNYDMARSRTSDLADLGGGLSFTYGPRSISGAPSAPGSRPGSRLGSRANLAGLTPAVGSRSGLSKSTSRQEDSYFPSNQPDVTAMGPNFLEREESFEVDDEDEDDAEEDRREEAEVAKLADDRSYGLGSVVDRVMGWTFFDMKDEDKSEEDDSSALKEERRRRVQRFESTNINIGPQPSSPPSRSTRRDIENGDDGGGWKDAAWLLSVASRALF